MINEIRHALKSGDNNKIASLYESISGKTIDRNCGECISDAKIALKVRLAEMERESFPIHLYLLNPSEETIWQNENNPSLERVLIVNTIGEAFRYFNDNTVNIIAQDVFFDLTLPAVKQIKPYQAYALDGYDWNGNGSARLVKNNPCAWVFSGKAKQITDLSKLTGYVVSNPFDSVHALRLTI